MFSDVTSKDRHGAGRADLLVALIELRSEALLAATVAACAVVAHADGEVAPAERRRVVTLMRTNPLLSMFPRDVVQTAFAAQQRAFERDAEAARSAALGVVATLAERPRHARVVLEACRAITLADARVHTREIAAMHRVRAALRLPPEEEDGRI
jgi:tellurite resistance protein TerB